MLDTVN